MYETAARHDGLIEPNASYVVTGVVRVLVQLISTTTYNWDVHRPPPSNPVGMPVGMLLLDPILLLLWFWPCKYCCNRSRYVIGMKPNPFM